MFVVFVIEGCFKRAQAGSAFRSSTAEQLPESIICSFLRFGTLGKAEEASVTHFGPR